MQTAESLQVATVTAVILSVGKVAQMSSHQQSEEKEPVTPLPDDSSGLEVELKRADALVKHGGKDTEVTKMLESLSVTVSRKMDESERELHERSRGLIHKDARLWFIPVILLLIVLVGIVYWGIAGRSSKTEDLFDKIVSNQDKFETVRTLRYAEQHEIYYSFYIIILGIILMVAGAAAMMASRTYTVSDARSAGFFGKKAALLSSMQMGQIRQDQEDKRDLKNEVKSKEKKIALAEEETRETQQKLSLTEKELELNRQQLEDTKVASMLREKMYQSEVKQLASDKESLMDDLHQQQKSQARLENELRNQRERERVEQDNLRQRLAAERAKQDAAAEAAYYKGRESKSDSSCLLMCIL